MSLILDALNRSEESRRHQPDPDPKKKVLSITGRKGGRRRPRWLFVLPLILVLCVFAWNLWRAATPATPATVAVAEDRTTEVRAKITAERSAVQAQTGEIAFAVQTTEVPVDVASVPRQAQLAAATVSASASAVDEPGSVAPTSKVERMVYPGSELAEVVSDLDLSMHFYSPDAKRSLVRVNGMLLHERDTVSGRMFIDEITPDGIVVSYLGRLYELQRPGS
jgi:hypothetical protein